MSITFIVYRYGCGCRGLLVVLLGVGCVIPLSSIGVGVDVVRCWVVSLGVGCVIPL